MTDMKVHLQMNDAENAVPLITLGADVSESPIRVEVVVQGFEPGPEGARAVAEALQATAEALLVELGVRAEDPKPEQPYALGPAEPWPATESSGDGMRGYVTPQRVLDARAARAEARARRRFNPK